MMQTEFIYDYTPRFVHSYVLAGSRFTGKERDAESGNDYFGARYYASNMGRFLSPDPSQLYYADPTNPQSLNLYAYVQNNPLINVDPDGLDCVYFNDDNSVNHILQGDCASTQDNGYYIDTTGVTSATLSDSGDLTSYSTNQGSFLPDGTPNDSSVTVSASTVDPDEERIAELSLGITADSQHSFGCIAQAFGIGAGGTAANAAGSATNSAGTNLWNSSQTFVGKSKAARGLGGGTTDFTSEAAIAARNSSWGSIKVPSVPTPMGDFRNGTGYWEASGSLGGIAGRYAPYAAKVMQGVGVATKAAGIAATAYSAYKLWNCL